MQRARPEPGIESMASSASSPGASVRRRARSASAPSAERRRRDDLKASDRLPPVQCHRMVHSMGAWRRDGFVSKAEPCLQMVLACGSDAF